MADVFFNGSGQAAHYTRETQRLETQKAAFGVDGDLRFIDWCRAQYASRGSLGPEFVPEDDDEADFDEDPR